MSKLTKGDDVRWKWGDAWAQGQIKSIFPKKTTRKIKGSEITRNGTLENPAVYIVQDDKGRVLKLASEVEKI